MTIIIELELTPEQERAFGKEAARRGLPLAAYAAALLMQHLPRGEAAPVGARNPGDRAEAFREWAASHNIDNPLLAEEALTHPRLPEENVP